MGDTAKRRYKLDNDGGQLMNANDRIALLIGRLFLQNEAKDDALAEKDKLIEQLKKQLDKREDG